MLCPECKVIDMRVDKVEDDIIYYRCKKCGHTEEKKIENEDE